MINGEQNNLQQSIELQNERIIFADRVVRFNKPLEQRAWC